MNHNGLHSALTIDINMFLNEISTMLSVKFNAPITIMNATYTTFHIKYGISKEFKRR